MKQFLIPALLSTAFCTLALSDQSSTSHNPANGNERKILAAVAQGQAWLQDQQNTQGWWSTPKFPAITAFALAGLRPDAQVELSETCRKGYSFLISCAQPDGSIHGGSHIALTTAICVSVLARENRKEFDSVTHRGLEFLTRLIQSQESNEALDKDAASAQHLARKSEIRELSSSLENLARQRNATHSSDSAPAHVPLNWQGALDFLKEAQAKPFKPVKPLAYSGPAYALELPITTPPIYSDSGRLPLRELPGIGQGGLLSWTYADYQGGDSHVAMVMDWFRQNYTFEENPGLGSQGHFYFLYLASKLLAARGEVVLALADGRRVDWKRELAARILALQSRNGSWSNSNPAWMENDPCLVTSYMLLALRNIFGETDQNER